MITGFQPAISVLENWKRETEFEGQVKEDLLLGLIHDGIRHILTDEQTRPKIALLHIKKHKAALPKDFNKVGLLACLRQEYPKVTRGQMVEWVYKDLGTECEFKIERVCPKCSEDKCSCSTSIVTLEADHNFVRDYPEVFMKHWKHFSGAVGPKSDIFQSGGVSEPIFEILQPQLGNDTFEGISMHLGECTQMRFPYLYGPKTYKLQPPDILTADIPEGQLFLAYAGKVVDDLGLYMIPDIPEAYTAVTTFLDWKLMKRRFLGRLEPAAGNAYQLLRGEWKEAVAEARSLLGIPDENSWVRAVRKSWVIDNSQYYYGN